MPPPYTNLYDWMMHRYWFDSKFFDQSEWRYLKYPIRDHKAFTQNRRGRWSLNSLYISTSIDIPFSYHLKKSV